LACKVGTTCRRIHCRSCTRRSIAGEDLDDIFDDYDANNHVDNNGHHNANGRLTCGVSVAALPGRRSISARPAFRGERNLS
jgi:hypothetical protein